LTISIELLVIPKWATSFIILFLYIQYSLCLNMSWPLFPNSLQYRPTIHWNVHSIVTPRPSSKKCSKNVLFQNICYIVIQLSTFLYHPL
jgi:hypothetical protein